MQLQLVLLAVLGLGGFPALAAPTSTLLARQNDTPQCVDGQDGPGGSFDTLQDCEAVCYLSEGADGDNKNGSCKGQCLNVGRPAPIWTCRGDPITRWSVRVW